MTSINLVSPVGNGHTYSVRFKEPIEIEPNSSVYLNFAKFKRDANIFFQKDQSITFTLNSVLPTFDPDITTADNRTLESSVIDIPAVNPATGKTGYTPKELENLIVSKFAALKTKANGEISQFSAYDFVYNSIKTNEISLGLYKELQAIQTPTRATGNVRDAGAGGAGEYYVKSSATAQDPMYDSYCITDEFLDFAYESDIYGSDNLSSPVKNVYRFRMNKSITEQQGNVSVGLHSSTLMGKEWGYSNIDANQIWTSGSTATKTNPSGVEKFNPAIYTERANNAISADEADGSVLGKGILGSYLTCELTGALAGKRKLRIYVLKSHSGSSRFISSLTSLGADDAQANYMHKTFEVDMRVLAGNADYDTTNIEIAVQIYVDNNPHIKPENQDVGVRVYNLTQSGLMNEDTLLFTKSIFTLGALSNTTTSGSAAVQKQKLLHQIPFNIICAATHQNEGVMDLKMNSLPNLPRVVGNPYTIIKKYQMTMSNELSNYVGETTTEQLNPNQSEEIVDKITNTQAEDYSNDSYSIFLKNLPIRAFKNIQSNPLTDSGNVQSAGYTQPIIYDVPTPYENSRVHNAGNGVATIVGTFQPSIVKTLKLDNNKMVLNNLDVEIRDIETNEIVDGLTGSVINFTIEK